MRTNVSNEQMPGVQSERTMSMAKELRRDAVYRDGVFIGEVVYVRRRRKAPASSPSSTGFVSEYGWRPDGWRYAANAKLTSKVDAIRRLVPVVPHAEH